MDQSSLNLKRPWCYCSDETLIAKDKWYKIEVVELVKLSQKFKVPEMTINVPRARSSFPKWKI